MFGSSGPDDCPPFGEAVPPNIASDGWLPSYPAVLQDSSRQWHGPTRMSASQNPALMPWGLTKSCEPTDDTATQISAREIGELVLGGHRGHGK